jgi:alkyl hydroperoxide reductase subunit AhpC
MQFVCPTEILSFAASSSEFANLNTSLLACSTDSLYSHLAWINTSTSEGGLGKNLNLDLLSDRNWKIARAFGVLDEDEGKAVRGLFIIDPKGILRQVVIK